MGFDFAGYFEAWNSFKGSRVASFFTEDGVYEDVELKRRMVGHEEISGFVEEAPINLSTDLRFELHRVVGENQAGYLVEWRMSGTHDRDSPNLRATHRRFNLIGTSAGVFAAGRLKLNVDSWSVVEFVRQVTATG